MKKDEIENILKQTRKNNKIAMILIVISIVILIVNCIRILLK